jgi:probable rRNA maturation factor
MSDVTVLNRQRKHPVDTAALRRAGEALLAGVGRDAAELTVTLVSDARMRELNRTYRGIDAATDVLSFAQEEGEALPTGEGLPEVLGDVVLSTETAARQAPDNAPAGLDPAAALQRELTYLLLHGVLHLVGHDHDADADHERMQAETRRLWPAVDAWAGADPRSAADPEP